MSKASDTSTTRDRTNPDAGRLLQRQHQLWRAVQEQVPGCSTVLIMGKVNQYYLTGTMQDGILVLRPDTSYLFVRKSYERARAECPLDRVIKMNSYRDMLAYLPADLGRVCLETEIVPLAALERLQKYFSMTGIDSIDRIILNQRSVKDHDEMALITESGRQHNLLLRQVVPGLLREGMRETDLLAEIYEAMVKLGHHGVSRFGMFQMELVVGQMGFGENSLYPTNFNGPGGMRGLSPAVPIIGDRSRQLKKGDLVFVDVGYGYEGYHSDKTQVYSFGSKPQPEAVRIHAACREVMQRLASQIVPGAIPAEIYRTILSDLPAGLERHFMGYGDDAVRFLGHGVGLQVDEYPVVADGMRAPLLENMVLALEPKCGVPGIGMVGVEETYAVTDHGAVCMTGGDLPIMTVD